MRFIDEATIRVSAGRGGPGCVSFRRETFIPRGGPDGGDGGHGGDVIFVATAQLSTLQDFRYKREYKGDSGIHGSGSNKAGRDGIDLEIRVPVGTVIRDAVNSETLIDFTYEGQRWVACHGGRGGKGNAHFVSSTFQAPKFAQPGEEGEFKEIALELKLLADAAIIGQPNAGKSTLISRLSAARPKVGDYPFTTLTPNLGVVQMPDLQTFVVADIPGLIEGAHAGLGLGHKFLRHIERTRVFVHLLDGTKLLDDVTSPSVDEKDFTPVIDEFIHRYQAIRNELGLFNEALLHKPEIVALNKVDLFETNPDLVDKVREALRLRLNHIRGVPPMKGEPFIISCVSGRGIPELLTAMYGEVTAARQALSGEAVTQLPDHEMIRAK